MIKPDNGRSAQMLDDYGCQTKMEICLLDVGTAETMDKVYSDEDNNF